MDSILAEAVRTNPKADSRTNVSLRVQDRVSCAVLPHPLLPCSLPYQAPNAVTQELCCAPLFVAATSPDLF